MKMGNCIDLGKPKSKPRVEKATKHSKIVQIVEMKGKIIELKTQTTVGNFLENFSGFSLSILPVSAPFLPPTYELKKGSTYYLVPTNTEQKQSVKRIKVVITKQQLQELLAKQKTVEEVLLYMKIKSFCTETDDDYSTSAYSKKKTKLEPIPEEIE